MVETLCLISSINLPCEGKVRRSFFFLMSGDIRNIDAGDWNCIN